MRSQRAVAAFAPVAQDEGSASSCASSSDNDEDEGVQASAAARGRQRRQAAGALVAAGLLVAASAPQLAGRRSAVRAGGGGGLVSDSSQAFVTFPAYGSHLPRYGCSNWNEIMLEYPSQLVGESCPDLCKKTAGCVFANLQPGGCGGTEQVAKGACYLYGAGCRRKENPCWDLYVAPGRPAFTINEHRAGCTNFDDIKLAEPSVVGNAYECGALCGNTTGCVQFNYQPGSCVDNDRQICQGACYLLGKDGKKCEKERNPCWDLYDYIDGSSVGWQTWITTTAHRGASSMQVADTSGLVVGAKVSIIFSTNMRQDVTVTGKPSADGDISFSPPLTEPAEFASVIFVDQAR